MPPTGLIHILTVDDHPVFRDGLAAAISRQPDMIVVAEAATGMEAIDLFRRHRPDVTLMDLRLPGLGGVEAIRVIRAEFGQARIVVLTTFEGDEEIRRALAAGAVAYLLKHTLRQDLVNTIRAVHAGQRCVPPEIAARLAEHSSAPDLTVRERHALELMAQGLRNKEIAHAMGVSEETVKSHVKAVLSKLAVEDRVTAVTAALRRGVISL